MRNNNDWEDILRQGQKQNEPDKKVYKVQDGDEETILMEQDTKIVYEQDPENPDILTPKVVSEVVQMLDSEGLAFSKTSEVGRCSFGCTVRKDRLENCSHCRDQVCFKDRLHFGHRYYCRRSPCIVVGRILQALLFVYWIIRFCFFSVTGLYTDESRAKRGIFGGSE